MGSRTTTSTSKTVSLSKSCFIHIFIRLLCLFPRACNHVINTSRVLYDPRALGDHDEIETFLAENLFICSPL